METQRLENENVKEGGMCFDKNEFISQQRYEIVLCIKECNRFTTNQENNAS